MNSIVALTGVELETPQLEPAVAYYADPFGLTVSHRDAQRTSLKGTGRQPRQVSFLAGTCSRLKGLNFEMEPSTEPLRLAEKLSHKGVKILSVSETSVAFADPDGTAIVVSRTPEWRPEDLSHSENRPICLSHVVLNSPDAPRLIAFYVDTLGFSVSDKYERGLLTLLRCNQPQHHCVGISPASYSGLNHFAMECGTIDAVMTGVGRMKRAGLESIWGPGRHGPGGNVFCYFEDPSGFVAEFTCEVLSISDPDHWQPKEWARTPENANVWGTGGASPRAIKLMNESPPGH